MCTANGNSAVRGGLRGDAEHSGRSEERVSETLRGCSLLLTTALGHEG